MTENLDPNDIAEMADMMAQLGELSGKLAIATLKGDFITAAAGMHTVEDVAGELSECLDLIVNAIISE